jgi:hypothetical protein
MLRAVAGGCLVSAGDMFTSCHFGLSKDSLVLVRVHLRLQAVNFYVPSSHSCVCFSPEVLSILRIGLQRVAVD